MKLETYVVVTENFFLFVCFVFLGRRLGLIQCL